MIGAACGTAVESGTSVGGSTSQTDQASSTAVAESEPVVVEEGPADSPPSLLTGEFATLAGSSIDLGSLEGQDVVLWFWAPW